MPTMLITGANRGIGLGFVAHYLAQGWQVFAACRQPESAKALHDLRENYPNKLTLIPLDVAREDNIRAAYEVVRGQTAKLDVLINNAGIFHKSSDSGEVTAEGLRQSFEVNTIAPFLIGRTFADLLGTGGKLVNITMPTQPVTKLTRTENHAYVASRYALNALTKMLALEFAERGIITVALYPGYLQTDMNGHAAEAKPLSEGIPLAAAVIDSLTPDHNGQCLLHNGSVYEW
jgi:NAD(P)-dependent dehydrogenase (short-subunit alcohol dehydrogenase family)